MGGDAVRYHDRERLRLAALATYHILDTGRDDALDVLVRSAALLVGAPIAALVFVDYGRQWFKATYGGITDGETPREWSICSDVVAQDAPLVIPDLRLNPRYAVNPAVSGASYAFRAYAGVPLSGPDGLPLGALCVLDTRTRHFTPTDIQLLQRLGAVIMAVLDARRDTIAASHAAPSELSGSAARAFITPSLIRSGLEHGEFHAFYQPVVTLARGRMVSMEALARWDLPGVGLVPPALFMPHVQRSPMLSQLLTTSMLHEVCGQLVEWRRRPDATQLTCSVNVTGSDTSSGSLFEMVSTALDRSGLPPHALTLELTETLGLTDREVALGELEMLDTLGVGIVLDDFGVGYSGLELLSVLPISGLKIDRSFVKEIDRLPKVRAAISSTVALAASLGLYTVGEGVETAGQAVQLRAAGVTRAQGYLFGRPVPADQATTLLAASNPEHRLASQTLRRPNRQGQSALRSSA